MKKLIPTIIVIAAVIIVLFVAAPFYIVEEGEQAVIVQMGKLTAVVTEAGLHVKTPFIDSVVTYPKKIMRWDGEPKNMPTREKQYIWVDVTARWRIADPQKFYESITALQSAYNKLSDIIDSEVRTVVAENYLRESVRNTNLIVDKKNSPDVLGIGEGIDESQVATLMQQTDNTREPIAKGRRQLAGEILQRSRSMMGEYGIELIDVVTRQIRYTDELTQSVYARMIKERNQIAEAFRSEGRGKRAEWLGRTDSERRSILSDAYAQAEDIRGKADADASRVYALAYNRDRNFFSFWRAIESYRTTIPKFNKTLTTNMDYFRYLYSPDGR
jgi:membrane protease subunit HflC